MQKHCLPYYRWYMSISSSPVSADVISYLESTVNGSLVEVPALPLRPGVKAEGLNHRILQLELALDKIG